MLRAILTILTWASALIAAGALAAWGLGRIVTDSWGWSQFIWWIPSPAAVVFVAVELTLAWVFAACAKRSPDARPRAGTRPGSAPARRTSLVLWLAWAGMTGYMLIGEWHAQRYLAPLKPGAGQKPVRVLFWNAEMERLPQFEQRVIDQEPDIAVVANAPRAADWQMVRSTMGPTAAVVSARFRVVSKYPVRRWGWLDLKIPGVRPRVFAGQNWGNIAFDTGQAMFVELDAAELGGRVVVWVLDLPSDPQLSRREMLKETADEIAAFKGPVMRRGEDGLDRAENADTPGFPKPDLLLGDCNTPRGSWSLRQIAGGMSAAFDQAGRGFAATWPRRFPIIAIDQAFVSSRLRAVGYRILDLGAAMHRAELIELVGEDR